MNHKKTTNSLEFLKDPAQTVKVDYDMTWLLTVITRQHEVSRIALTKPFQAQIVVKVPAR